MNALTFAEPERAILLALVLVLTIALWWLDGRGSRALERLVGTTLQSSLVTTIAPSRRRTRIVLTGIACAFMVVALMRPQWGNVSIMTPRSGAEIMIALDVSRSMLAEDATPNRLDRAKADIRDLLTRLDGDQVGLIAFAGRASVLTPLTPDLRYVDLALDDARPGRTGLGGTRLEEPIRKAMAGFGGTGNVSRSILLITDGEDLDSFPREAAKAAAERGVRILSIGFGSEQGSPIVISDPRTGAKSQLRGPDGTTVQSRLDGTLLRELAQLTDGAYIPAGTGSLDLDAIYNAHIAPLTRGELDGRERIIPNDVFQWPVLAALIALLGAVATTASARLMSVVLLGLTLGALTPERSARAQAPASPPATAPAQPTSLPPATLLAKEPTVNPTPDREAPSAAPALPKDAREAYNAGVAALGRGNSEAARTLLEHSRKQSGSDAEVRFNATFNLAWTWIAVAEGYRESEKLPDAVEALETASVWFSEAVQLRPEDTRARENLERTQLMALQLADSLREKDNAQWTVRLTAILGDLEGLMAGLGTTLVSSSAEATSGTTSGAISGATPGAPSSADTPTNSSSSVAPQQATGRSQMRSLATRTLTVIADAQAVLDDAVKAAGVIDPKTATPEDRVKKQTLEESTQHIFSALGRLGQQRARLRRGQGLEAYRRGDRARSDLNRALEAFAAPAARISALASSAQNQIRLGNAAQSDNPPAWLTPALRADRAASLADRGVLLVELFANATATPNPSAPSAPSAPATSEDAAQDTQRTLDAMRRALPHLKTASTQLTSAREHDGNSHITQMMTATDNALRSLRIAQEQFLELRALIERAYTTQQQVRQILETLVVDEGNTAAWQAVRALHATNIERLVGIGERLSEAMTDDNEERATERQQAETGYPLWTGARDAMHQATSPLVDATTPADRSPDRSSLAKASVDTAVAALDELRRHFFTVIDRLRESVTRQAAINPVTMAAGGLLKAGATTRAAQSFGEVTLAQNELLEQLPPIAEELQSIGEQAAANPADKAAGASPAPQTGPTPETFLQASQLVEQAHKHVDSAVDGLEQPTPPVDAVAESQASALSALQEALALLQPPNEGDGENQESQSDDNEQTEQQQRSAEQRDQAGADNMERLLQGVRDREANRRDEKADERAVRGQVEKDW
jgi:Ca-activated chloride channel family protein